MYLPFRWMKDLKALMKDIKIELEGDPFFQDEEIDKKKL